ncbi:MAG: DUF4382 domain-containing protein [Gammaproteobacteria bacterium]
MLFKRFNMLPVYILLLASAGLLAACGASDTSGESTGSVQVLLTDGPTDEFDQVNVSVDSIQLLGEGPNVYLLTEPASFNLLDLRHCSALLAVNHDVPVGTYSKLRLDVSAIELVRLNPDGSVKQTIVPKLPSGRIDLNPQGQFSVAAGDRLVIELDMDAEKSIHITTTGNDKYIFRPQVFVDVMSDASASLIRLSGKALDVQDDHFQLCKMGTPADGNCIQVNIVVGTVVMSSEIMLASYADVAEGDSVLVFGHLDTTAHAINAVRVFDDTIMLPMFRGDFSGVIAADAIDLRITKDAPGVVTNDVLPVQPLSPAAIYDDQGNALNLNAIADNVSAEVIGVLMPDAATPSEIRPGMIIIQAP